MSTQLQADPSLQPSLLQLAVVCGPEQLELRDRFVIKLYPTLLLFVNGELKVEYPRFVALLAACCLLLAACCLLLAACVALAVFFTLSSTTLYSFKQCRLGILYGFTSGLYREAPRSVRHLLKFCLDACWAEQDTIQTAASFCMTMLVPRVLFAE